MNLDLNPLDFIPKMYTCKYNNSRPPNEDENRENCPRQPPTKCLLVYLMNITLCLVFFVVVIYAYNQSVYLYNSATNPMYSDEEVCVENCNRNIINDYVVNNNNNNDISNDTTDLEREIRELKEKVQELMKFKENVEGKLSDEKSVLSMEEVEKKINGALRTYDADGIGTFDYAAKNSGGEILSTPDTSPFPMNQSVSLFYLFSRQLVSNPERILEKSNYPGNCFAFCGSSGRIRIKLSKKVKVVAVTIDHAPFSLLDDLSHATKDFAVYGLCDKNDSDGELLGKFTYKIEDDHVQTFLIDPEKINYYEYIELIIENNHGNNNYTCLYRFRVHSSRLPIKNYKK